MPGYHVLRDACSFPRRCSSPPLESPQCIQLSSYRLRSQNITADNYVAGAEIITSVAGSVPSSVEVRVYALGLGVNLRTIANELLVSSVTLDIV